MSTPMREPSGQSALRCLLLSSVLPLLCLLLATAESVAAPVLPTASAAPAAVPNDADPTTMVLPSETCHGLFIVPVTLGEGEGTTIDLLLDTGAQWTFIDPEAIRAMIGGTMDVGKVEFKNARIGRHEIGPLKASLYSMKTLSLAVGRKFDGILGYSVFKEVLLTLDYPAKEITVSSGRLPEADEREVFRYYGSKRPYLKIDVGGRRVKVLIDSGSAGRIKLKASDRFDWSVEPRTVGASVMFASTILRTAGRMQGDIQFGPLTFESPVVALSGDERYAGWHLLRHFVLTFDQKKKRVRMQTDETAPVVLASLVGTGIATRPRPQGLEIIDVQPGTPGATTGLRKGDLIVAVDGEPVPKQDCRDPLGSPPGRRQVLTYVRENIRADVEITTEVLIP